MFFGKAFRLDVRYRTLIRPFFEGRNVVAGSNRPENRVDQENGDLVRSLMDEFLISARNPVDSSIDRSSAARSNPSPARKDTFGSAAKHPPRDLFWLLLVYLVAVGGLMVGAAVFLLF
jgi:hypothetical protein